MSKFSGSSFGVCEKILVSSFILSDPAEIVTPPSAIFLRPWGEKDSKKKKEKYSQKQLYLHKKLFFSTKVKTVNSNSKKLKGNILETGFYF